MSAQPPVTVIVPTHDHAATLEWSLRSVLEQTYPDFRLVVIGDGVGDDTRDVVAGLRTQDSRIEFLDRPKAPRHGEILRAEVLAGTSSPIIAYHGDDDLLLAHHLDEMVPLLDEAEFAHPLPILVDDTGTLIHLATDLSLSQCREWHLGTPHRNAVSLTGVVHTLEAYRRLPHGWRTTPTGRWTDHYMWQQFLSDPHIRAVTSPVATTVKLAASQRSSWTADERASDVRKWWDRIHQPNFDEDWDELVARAIRRAAVDATIGAAHFQDRCTALESEVSTLTETAGQLQVEARALHARADAERLRADELEAALEGLTNSRSWRVTAPLRSLRRGRR